MSPSQIIWQDVCNESEDRREIQTRMGTAKYAKYAKKFGCKYRDENREISEKNANATNFNSCRVADKSGR